MSARRTIPHAAIVALKQAALGGIKHGDVKRIAEQHGCRSGSLQSALLTMRMRNEVPDVRRDEDRMFLASVRSRGGR